MAGEAQGSESDSQAGRSSVSKANMLQSALQVADGESLMHDSRLQQAIEAERQERVTENLALRKSMDRIASELERLATGACAGPSSEGSMEMRVTCLAGKLEATCRDTVAAVREECLRLQAQEATRLTLLVEKQEALEQQVVDSVLRLKTMEDQVLAIKTDAEVGVTAIGSKLTALDTALRKDVEQTLRDVDARTRETRNNVLQYNSEAHAAKEDLRRSVTTDLRDLEQALRLEMQSSVQAVTLQQTSLQERIDERLLCLDEQCATIHEKQRQLRSSHDASQSSLVQDFHTLDSDLRKELLRLSSDQKVALRQAQNEIVLGLDEQLKECQEKARTQCKEELAEMSGKLAALLEKHAQTTSRLEAVERQSQKALFDVSDDQRASLTTVMGQMAEMRSSSAADIAELQQKLQSLRIEVFNTLPSHLQGATLNEEVASRNAAVEREQAELRKKIEELVQLVASITDALRRAEDDRDRMDARHTELRNDHQQSRKEQSEAVEAIKRECMEGLVQNQGLCSSIEMKLEQLCSDRSFCASSESSSASSLRGELADLSCLVTAQTAQMQILKEMQATDKRFLMDRADAVEKATLEQLAAQIKEPLADPTIAEALQNASAQVEELRSEVKLELVEQERLSRVSTAALEESLRAEIACANQAWQAEVQAVKDAAAAMEAELAREMQRVAGDLQEQFATEQTQQVTIHTASAEARDMILLRVESLEEEVKASGARLESALMSHQAQLDTQHEDKIEIAEKSQSDLQAEVSLLSGKVDALVETCNPTVQRLQSGFADFQQQILGQLSEQQDVNLVATETMNDVAAKCQSAERSMRRELEQVISRLCPLEESVKAHKDEFQSSHASLHELFESAIAKYESLEAWTRSTVHARQDDEHQVLEEKLQDMQASNKVAVTSLEGRLERLDQQMRSELSALGESQRKISQQVEEQQDGSTARGHLERIIRIEGDMQIYASQLKNMKEEWHLEQEGSRTLVLDQRSSVEASLSNMKRQIAAMESHLQRSLQGSSEAVSALDTRFTEDLQRGLGTMSKERANLQLVLQEQLSKHEVALQGLRTETSALLCDRDTAISKLREQFEVIRSSKMQQNGFEKVQQELSTMMQHRLEAWEERLRGEMVTATDKNASLLSDLETRRRSADHETDAAQRRWEVLHSEVANLKTEMAQDKGAYDQRLDEHKVAIELECRKMLATNEGNHSFILERLKFMEEELRLELMRAEKELQTTNTALRQEFVGQVPKGAASGGIEQKHSAGKQDPSDTECMLAVKSLQERTAQLAVEVQDCEAALRQELQEAQQHRDRDRDSLIERLRGVDSELRQEIDDVAGKSHKSALSSIELVDRGLRGELARLQKEQREEMATIQGVLSEQRTGVNSLSSFTHDKLIEMRKAYVELEQRIYDLQNQQHQSSEVTTENSSPCDTNAFTIVRDELDALSTRLDSIAGKEQALVTRAAFEEETSRIWEAVTTHTHDLQAPQLSPSEPPWQQVVTESVTPRGLAAPVHPGPMSPCRVVPNLTGSLPRSITPPVRRPGAFTPPYPAVFSPNSAATCWRNPMPRR